MLAFAFVSSSHCLKFHCQHSTGMQLTGLWGCWMGPPSEEPLTMLRVRCGAPLLPGLPLSCLFQYHSGPISHDFPKSGCALGSLAHSWRAWHVCLRCLLAGGTLLALAAVSLHPPLSCAVHPHTHGLPCSGLHFHASVC